MSKQQRTVADLVATLKALPQNTFVAMQLETDGGRSVIVEIDNVHLLPEDGRATACLFLIGRVSRRDL
jgi:hypothetical protein